MNITALLHEAAPAAYGRDTPGKTPALDRDVPMPSREDGGRSSLSTNSSRWDESSTPSQTSRRPRIPWDANGFSILPDGSAVKLSPRPEQASASLYPVSEEAASPNSLKHKFSDSQSTLASYTPSSSLSHSRFSSMSTTGCEHGIGPMHNGSSPEQGQILMANHFAHDREEHTNYNYITPLAADSTRAHKRTTSAPDPSSLYSIHHPATYLPTPTHIFNTESSNPAMENPGIDHPSDPEEPAGDCMHNDTTCDTGSVLRKAISHIFGRNKVCTRMIPNHIWVHLCRKHYQRSRYRSGHDYAVRQCELVLQQIQRIHDWSEENKKQGKISINKGWKLDMRKREKKRVEETENKKRRYSETDMDENTSRGTKNNTATAVPTWLRLKCGEGYSTDEILEIMRRLQGEIQAKERAQMPDLEILPDIVPDSTEETKPRAPSKRPTTHYTAHKRSKSYSMGMHASSPYVHVPGRPNSLPSWHQENYGGFTGADRWQRTMDQMPPHINHTEFRLGEAPSREASIMSHIPHPMNNIPYRPTYPYSRGNSAEGTPDNNQAVNNPHYGYDGQPVSRRFTNAPTLTASEPNTTGHGRPLHSRSVSEYTLPQASFTFRMNEPSPQQAARPIYPDQSYRAPSTSHYPSIPTQGYVRPTTETNWPHQGYTYTPRETLKHARHQSTPNPDFPYYQPHVYENSQRQSNMVMHSHPQYPPRSNVPILELPEPGKLGPHYNSKQC